MSWNAGQRKSLCVWLQEKKEVKSHTDKATSIYNFLGTYEVCAVGPACLHSSVNTYLGKLSVAYVCVLHLLNDTKGKCHKICISLSSNAWNRVFPHPIKGFWALLLANKYLFTRTEHEHSFEVGCLKTGCICYVNSLFVLISINCWEKYGPICS